eukprot:UN26738
MDKECGTGECTDQINECPPKQTCEDSEEICMDGYFKNDAQNSNECVGSVCHITNDDNFVQADHDACCTERANCVTALVFGDDGTVQDLCGEGYAPLMD